MNGAENVYNALKQHGRIIVNDESDATQVYTWRSVVVGGGSKGSRDLWPAGEGGRLCESSYIKLFRIPFWTDSADAADALARPATANGNFDKTLR